MRITTGGIYVMVEKYGIEGLLVLNDTDPRTEESKSGRLELEARPEKEEATITAGKKSIVIRTFDRINVQIKAQMVEFRRTVNLVFVPK